MRILAISDIHGSHKAMKKLRVSSKNVDLIIIPGDITIFGSHIEEIMKKINQLKKKTLLITGNHEHPAHVARLAKKFKYIHFMNNKIIKIKNMLIYGYDTNGFSFKDSSFEKDSKKFVMAIKDKLKTILISHAPPYGTKADKIIDGHCGSKSVRDFCNKNKINYCFCGHIHEASHTVDKLKKTIVVNPGPYGMMFEI